MLGVVIAFATGVAFEANATAILHFALGASFFLIASAVFDFSLPSWINWVGGACIAVLAAVFLLQGISDVVQSPPLANFAYNVLGQYLEKALGYAFILWCACVVSSTAEIEHVYSATRLCSWCLWSSSTVIRSEPGGSPHQTG